jgi:arylsulfatase A-like enzyme
MPTVLDIAGIRPRKNEMQGVSLKALWQTGRALEPLPAFTEGLSGYSEKKSLRKGRYKYIVSMSKEQVAKVGRLRLPDSPVERELYDLRNDPREKNNLLLHPNEHIAGLAGNYHNELVRILESDQGTVKPLKLEKETMERLQGLGYMN